MLTEGRGSVATMLEDDSGRIRLVGRALRSALLVTGCIVAVLGTENKNGELEVIDIVFPDLPPQPARWQLEGHPPAQNGDAANGNGHATPPPAKRAKTDDGDVAMGEDSGGGGKKIAIVSGLGFSGPHGATAVETALLLEFLLGESLVPELQRAAASISRLIIAGNSLVSADELDAQNAAAAAAAAAAATAAAAAAADSTAAEAQQQHKKYGYDSSSYNPVPSALLDDFLGELLPSMPVTLLPGVDDSANASLPQQPIHPAMFPRARLYASAVAPGRPHAQTEPGWFDTVTNPWEAEVAGWRVLGTSGQTIDDIARYLPASAGADRLAIMEATCRWRCCAPTAPDTLWSYPFQEDDPFVLDACPHLYFAGSQPAFATSVIEGPDGQAVRLVAVPAFSATRELVLLDTETLDVTRIVLGRSNGDS